MDRRWPFLCFIRIFYHRNSFAGEKQRGVFQKLLRAPDPTMEALLSKQRFIWLHSVNFGMFFYRVIFHQATIGVPHFWSLAVEEHFYLVWPFLVYLFSLKSLWKVCLLIIGLAFLARCVGVYLGLHPFYFTLTFCRFDALAIKALLATFAHENTLVKLLPYAK